MSTEKTRKKPVTRSQMPPEQRLLVDRRNAAQYLFNLATES
jgi:hypothetical protein